MMRRMGMILCLAVALSMSGREAKAQWGYGGWGWGGGWGTTPQIAASRRRAIRDGRGDVQPRHRPGPEH